MIVRITKGMVFIMTVAALTATQVAVYSHDDSVPKDIAGKKNPVPASEAVLKKAQTAYDENCLMCHGKTGKGDGPMAGMLAKPPNDISAANSKMIGEMPDGEIYWVLTKGMKPMPPFETKLSDEERWGLVHLVRNLSKTKSHNNPRKHNH